MKIIGNIETANKFYIHSDNGGLEWVSSLALAKSYASDRAIVNWYNKDIYATNEEIIKIADGTKHLASTVKEEDLEIRDINSEFEDFKEQGLGFLKGKLQEFATDYKYDTIESMVSWSGSKNKVYSTEAKLAITYRDTVYAYYFEAVNNFSKNTKTKELTELYFEYINNFPTYTK